MDELTTDKDEAPRIAPTTASTSTAFDDASNNDNDGSANANNNNNNDDNNNNEENVIFLPIQETIGSGENSFTKVLLTEETAKPVPEFTDEFWDKLRGGLLHELQNHGRCCPCFIFVSAAFLLVQISSITLMEADTSRLTLSQFLIMTLTAAWLSHVQKPHPFFAAMLAGMILFSALICVLMLITIYEQTNHILLHPFLAVLLSMTFYYPHYCDDSWRRKKCLVQQFTDLVNLYCGGDLKGYRIDYKYMGSVRGLAFCREILPTVTTGDAAAANDDDDAVPTDMDLEPYPPLLLFHEGNVVDTNNATNSVHQTSTQLSDGYGNYIEERKLMKKAEMKQERFFNTSKKNHTITPDEILEEKMKEQWSHGVMEQLDIAPPSQPNNRQNCCIRVLLVKHKEDSSQPPTWSGYKHKMQEIHNKEAEYYVLDESKPPPQFQQNGMPTAFWRDFCQDISQTIDIHEKYLSAFPLVVTIQFIVCVLYYVIFGAVSMFVPFDISTPWIVTRVLQNKMIEMFDVISDELGGCSVSKVSATTNGTEVAVAVAAMQHYQVSYHAVRWGSYQDDYIEFKQQECINYTTSTSSTASAFSAAGSIHI